MRPGPTGDYPQGRLDKFDEGGLNMAISAYRGTIRIDFGKKIAWFAVPPNQARELAALLIKHANMADMG